MLEAKIGGKMKYTERGNIAIIGKKMCANEKCIAIGKNILVSIKQSNVRNLTKKLGAEKNNQLCSCCVKIMSIYSFSLNARSSFF